MYTKNKKPVDNGKFRIIVIHYFQGTLYFSTRASAMQPYFNTDT